MANERPIVIVDDDSSQLAVASTVLEAEGFTVHCFTEASSALEHCAREAPALVLSDVVMPVASGFDFHARYAQRFPERTTPFVFLSSLGDPKAVVRGLDAGADDFLRKPIEPAVLTAKVRAILRRRRRAVASTFRGDLARFPLPSLLRFCEAHGLTGFVDVFDGDVLLALRFCAGQIDDPDADATLTRISELESAPFIVHSAPVDFGELGDSIVDGAARDAPRPSPTDTSATETGGAPIGRVSSVRLARRLFQVETEVFGDEPRFVVSAVSVEGRTVWKHSTRIGSDAGAADVAARIDEQHDAIEAKLNARFAEQVLERQASPAGRREQFHRLFDEGFDKFRARDYQGAIDCWEHALAIDPSSTSLRVNVRVAREKLAAQR